VNKVLLCCGTDITEPLIVEDDFQISYHQLVMRWWVVKHVG